MNDEGPMSLWTSKEPARPFECKAYYVLDGADGTMSYEMPSGAPKHIERWDAGRYSESRVWYYNGIFNLFASGSPDGWQDGSNPSPTELYQTSKVHEQIGWAGMNFTEVKFNPVTHWNGSTSHTIAMAESKVLFDDERS